ncbi:MAG: DUF3240 family protein, partial [Bacteroidota bacterium]
MQTVPHRLVTIIAERHLRDKLVDAVHRLGATGHTLTDVAGEGSRNAGGGRITGANIKLETIVAPAVAEGIAEHVAERYFQHHSVIVYVQ